MPKPTGRPSGYQLHREGFEAICGARGVMKKDVAADAGVSPQFLADLLYHRAGASSAVATRIADSLGVKVEAIFPGFANWVGPVPDRTNRKAVA
jgi:DNA-binding XRE family transcriptional regulator